MVKMNTFSQRRIVYVKTNITPEQHFGLELKKLFT